jgi:hypothetical protein
MLASSALGAFSCAGEKQESADTDSCVPYCEQRHAAGCNELGTIENCRLACGLLLTEPGPCGSASQALLDCRMEQPNICRGCSAEQNQASQACTM